MGEQEPVTELGAFSSEGGVPTAWAQGRRALQKSRAVLAFHGAPGWETPRHAAFGGVVRRCLVLLHGFDRA